MLVELQEIRTHIIKVSVINQIVFSNGPEPLYNIRASKAGMS